MQTLHNRRPDSSAGNHFSFSRPNAVHLEYDAWAETIKNTPNPFGRDGTDRKIGPWVRRNTAPNSSSSSGTHSPPLWRSTTQESLPNFSRTQLIAKYRQEMMDLVRGLDEPAYELSLRDMVESPVRMRPEEEVALTEKNASVDWMEKKDVKRKGRERRTLRRSSRSESTGKGGFLLKLFMPTVPALSRRETGAGVKVSPRPMAAAVDGEWSNCEYGERSSSNGSSGSSCGGRATKRWKLCSCYPFLHRSRRSSSI